MATIGLSNVVYSLITSDVDGYEIYDTPKKLGEAISADFSIELAENTLYADDGPLYASREFKGGKLSLNVADLQKEVLSDILGNTIDESGILISSTENEGREVAIGFRAQKAKGGFKLFWFYKMKFGTPSVNVKTKGDSIEYATPTIEGTILRRNKPLANGEHPWKAELDEGTAGVTSSVIADWFLSVYEPDFSEPEEVDQ